MRNLNGASELRREAHSKGLPLEVIELDVDDEISVQRAITNVLQREGQIDVLVNKESQPTAQSRNGQREGEKRFRD